MLHRHSQSANQSVSLLKFRMVSKYELFRVVLSNISFIKYLTTVLEPLEQSGQEAKKQELTGVKARLLGRRA